MPITNYSSPIDQNKLNMTDPTIDLGRIEIQKAISKAKAQQMIVENLTKYDAKPSATFTRQPAIQEAKQNDAKKTFLQKLGVGMMAFGEGMGGAPVYSTYMSNEAKKEAAQQAFQQQQIENQFKERELAVKEKPSLSYDAEGMSVKNRLLTRKLAVKIAGMRKASEIEPLIAGMIKQGVSPNDIEDQMREAGQSDKFTGDFRDAAQSVFSKASNDQREIGMDYIDQYLQKGDTAGALTQLKKSALDQADVGTRQKVWGRERTVKFLDEIQTGLEALQKSGIDTNIFTGTESQILEKIGKVKDPAINELANKIKLAMFQYRNDMSGVAFPESETKAYTGVFPSVGNEMKLNLAKIKSLKDVFTGANDQFYGAQIGYDMYKKLYKSDVAPSGKLNNKNLFEGL